MKYKRFLIPVVLVLAAATLTSAAAAGTTRAATVKLHQTSLGQILADSHGKTLYLFAHDKGRKSTCYGACAGYWPPLITKGTPRAAAGVRKSLLGTTRRRDGRLQVTYHGHPLYRFSGDTGAGQTTGEGLTDFGGVWDAVSAAGLAVQGGTGGPGYLPRRLSVHQRLEHGLLRIVGTPADDRIALRLKAGDPNTLEVDFGDNGSADFSFDLTKVSRISVDARAGDDVVRIDESNGVFTDKIPTRIDGGPGDDNIAGGSGAETLLGGPGNDVIDGNKGSDTAFLGSGDDTFVWDPGDGSDVVEGQDGLDTMLFNGSAGAEQFTLSANGNRLRFFRDVGTVTMDTAGVETVDVNTLGGADIVTVNDLTGTDVSGVNVDLASSIGGTTGDATADRVIVNGSARNDAIQALGDASLISVAGLQPHVSIQHQDTIDTLTLNGLDGADSIDASGLAANAIALQLNGGTGNDTIAGGQGAETSDGGPGNDVIDGNKGADTALLGTGDDTFVWDPGDGSDIVEGQAGLDTMRFNGAPGDEKFTLSANGTRFKLLRDVGNITMDTAGVETVDVNALGGADLVNVGDLTGTDVTKVNVDLASALGGTTGDGAFDQVVVTGTPGSDLLTLTGNASGVQVAGLPATVAISHQEPTDRLAINTLDGFDLVGTGGFVAGSMQLFIDGIQQ